MRTRKREVITTVFEVEVQGHWFGFSTLLNLVEELAEMDTYFDYILIHDDDLVMALKAEGVISSTGRGSWARGPDKEKFKAFEAKLEKIYQGE